jgi:hypothetical protein
MPCPCCGPKMSVLRINRSSVPCSRSKGSSWSRVDTLPKYVASLGQMSTETAANSGVPTMPSSRETNRSCLLGPLPLRKAIAQTSPPTPDPPQPASWIAFAPSPTHSCKRNNRGELAEICRAFSTRRKQLAPTRVPNMLNRKWFVNWYLQPIADAWKNALDFTPRWSYTPITNRFWRLRCRRI